MRACRAFRLRNCRVTRPLAGTFAAVVSDTRRLKITHTFERMFDIGGAYATHHACILD